MLGNDLTSMFLRDWKKYRQLHPGDREVARCAMVMLPIVGCVVKLRGYRRCQTLLRRFGSVRRNAASHDGRDDLACARRLAWLVNAAGSRSIGRPNCLTRSIVTCWILQRRGLEGQLRFGVAQSEHGRLAAHAWVESAGQIINDRVDIADQFQRLDRSSNAERLQPVRAG